MKVRPQSKWLRVLHQINILRLLILTGVVFLFTACPYSTFLQLDNEPQNPVQPAFFGVWKGVSRHEITGKLTQVELHISEEDDFHYKLDLIGYLGRVDRKRRPLLDTISAKAFLSNLDNRSFLNVKLEGQTYLVELQYDSKDELSLLPMAEEFTSYCIRNNEDLKAVLENHLKTRKQPTYDETFCLRNMKRVSQSIP
jgi:hypothetical protein